jgi:hypothetical protein
MPQHETTIASLTKRGEQLAAKRVTAQDALDEAIKTRQQALLSGDLDDQRVTHRIDGWILDPKNEDRIPAAVAEMIARAMPKPRDTAIAAIRARMLARHKKALGNV